MCCDDIVVVNPNYDDIVVINFVDDASVVGDDEESIESVDVIVDTRV